MIAFLTKRILQSLAVLAFVITATFLLMRLTPGSPFAAERKLPEKVEQKLLERYNLDGSLWEQCLNYWQNILRGDLGDSTKFENRSIVEILSQTFPKSASLGILSFILAITIGITLGSYAAVYHNSFKDKAAMLLALGGICSPTFIIAPCFILFFALWLPLFPVAGWGTVGQSILPVICLAAPYAAYCSRLVRTSMLEVLNQDYIRTAKAKGLSDLTVTYQHALKNGILPLVSYSGPLAAHILTGSLIIEEIFKIPGMGPFFVNSIINRDVFLLGGSVLIYCSLLLILNLIVDLFYTILDKRIKLW